MPVEARFKEVAVEVLSERNPAFDLDPNERYAAAIHGKELTYSVILRKGLAETLSMLGSLPGALGRVSRIDVESIAILTTREILGGRDWVLWGSVNDVLPMLAEAAPQEFMNQVEQTLDRDPCPFVELFKQESDGITGRNYMTGLLWALETLAWSSEYLPRVVRILGKSANLDPGGKWANRPINSAIDILLPWLPHTCAPIDRRVAAVRTLLRNQPDIGWQLLLALLPELHSATPGTHRPTWRKLIPDDWIEGATHGEIWEQYEAYAALALELSRSDSDKLIELIKRFSHLPKRVLNSLSEYLAGAEVQQLDANKNKLIWEELSAIVLECHRFSNSEQTISHKYIDQLGRLACLFKPTSILLKLEGLFSDRDFDLYEEKSNFEEQRKRLEQKRIGAAERITEECGLEGLIPFAEKVQSPRKLGYSLGYSNVIGIEERYLPKLLSDDRISASELISGFIWAKYQQSGRDLVSDLPLQDWQPHEQGIFLAKLPFRRETWDLAGKLLGDNGSEFWSRTNASPYEAQEHLSEAVEKLLEHQRPNEIIQCLSFLIHEGKDFHPKHAVAALQLILTDRKYQKRMDLHNVVEVIQELQRNEKTDPEELCRVEWGYLDLLDGVGGENGRPLTLEKKLAIEPAFFCEVLRLVFQSKNELEKPAEETDEKTKNFARNGWKLLGRWSLPPGQQDDGTFVIKHLRLGILRFGKHAMGVGIWRWP